MRPKSNFFLLIFSSYFKRSKSALSSNLWLHCTALNKNYNQIRYGFLDKVSKHKKVKQTNNINMKKINVWLLILASVFVGFVNGFFGGGGGMICVPVLEKFLHLDNKKSHATAIAVIVPLSLVSSIVYISKTSVNWMQVLWVGIGVCAGGILGAILLKKINSKMLRFIFAIIMLVAGIKTIFW